MALTAPRGGRGDSRHKNRIPIHFGLDALADFCDRDYEYNKNALYSATVTGVAFDQACHDAVIQLCALLELDPQVANPLDLDRLDRAFVCVNCPRDSGCSVFMTWRDAVSHADPDRRQAHTSKRPTFRLGSEIEKRYLKARLKRNQFNDFTNVWGCMHCSDHLAIRDRSFGDRDQYMSLANARRHLQEKHNRSSAIEGEDIYFKRRSTNNHRFVHLLYRGKRDRGRQLRTADDVVLPKEMSEDALLALAVAKETQNEQQAAAQLQLGRGMIDSDWDDDSD